MQLSDVIGEIAQVPVCAGILENRAEDLRRFQIREVASALVRSGTPIQTITSLAVLVDLKNLKAALRWMMGRFDDKPTEAIG